MAHNYYDLPFSQESRQAPSEPHLRTFFSNMSIRRSPTAPESSFARSIRHCLNEEPSRNIEYDFAAYSSPVERPFDRYESASSVKQEPTDDMFGPGQRPSSTGYMQRSSPFSLDYSTSEMSFLDWFPRGDATITYLNESGDIESISNLDPSYFQDRCPLLAQAFEPSRSGPKLYLEILTSATAMPFIRYLYTGSYAVPGRESDDIYEDVPTSVLLHCQIFRIADIYDLPDLKQQAYVNVTRQCEFGCSSPDKPIDLCEAIKYAYQHLADHAALLETIVCYCVTCFLEHRLAEDFEFRTMAFDLRPFQLHLVKECWKRGFEDESASAIISLPFKPYVPETYASREDYVHGSADVVYHFHSNDDYDASPKKRKRPEMTSVGTSAIALALRQLRDVDVEGNGEEATCDREDLGIGSSKRRASTVHREPVSSDSEFEILDGPAPVAVLSSDSESDNEIVGVERAGSDLVAHARELPIRRRGSVASSMTLVEPEVREIEHRRSDSGSESDWTLV